MDLWEANRESFALTPHPCETNEYFICETDNCGGTYSDERYAGSCDPDGCDLNPFRHGNTDFYGPGKTIDTDKKFTVVTQFPADEDGTLTSIHRLYVQDGEVIRAEAVNKEGVPAQNYMNDEYCGAMGSEKFLDLGATAAMGDAMTRGMVLAFSIWWDEGGNMSWLDGKADGAGPCNATEGSPDTIRKVEPSPEVTFSNIRWGEINSTFSATPAKGLRARLF